MRKMLLAMFLISGAIAGYSAKVEGIRIPKGDSFVIYTDKSAPGNHYVPSGYMGDYGDIRINDAYSEDVHSGKTCLQVVYTADKSQGQGWAGVYWQNPPNN